MTDKVTFDKENIFGQGQPNDAFVQYFDGQSFLNPLVSTDSPLFLANVTFEPNCRNYWHAHNTGKGGGRILICTAGQGWYQEEDREAVGLEPGKVIAILVNTEHWHGVKKDSRFSHISVEIPGENTSSTWLEAVSDDNYSAL